MSQPFNRRRLLQSSVASSLGFAQLSTLANLTPARAADSKVRPQDVQIDSSILPLVKLIDGTPREKSVQMMLEQLQKGVSWRQFLAAMFLVAAEINVSPHHVFMINAAQRLSLSVDREYRLLPLFWALDTLQYNRQDGSRYPKVDVGRVSPENAAKELHDAMAEFDSERAETAMVLLARSIGPKQAMAQLFQYAGRDDSYIGHRAIAVSNSWRVLDAIGWQHAEPMFQFVVRQLNGGKHAHIQHRPNLERLKRFGDLPYDWAGNKVDHAATLQLLDVMRVGKPGAACENAFEMLKSGQVQAGSVWDAVYLLGAEFMASYYASSSVGGTPLHTNTSANALRFVFDTCRDQSVRAYTLLEAVGWATHFFGIQVERSRIRDIQINALPEVSINDSAEDTVKAIFDQQPKRRYDETQKEILTGNVGPREDMDKVTNMAFAYASGRTDHSQFLRHARIITCLKATQNAHDIKFPAAMFENYENVSPRWRPHLLAASTHYLHSTQMVDNPAVQKVREALG